MDCTGLKSLQSPTVLFASSISPQLERIEKAPQSHSSLPLGGVGVGAHYCCIVLRKASFFSFSAIKRALTLTSLILFLR